MFLKVHNFIALQILVYTESTSPLRVRPLARLESLLGCGGKQREGSKIFHSTKIGLNGGHGPTCTVAIYSARETDRLEIDGNVTRDGEVRRLFNRCECLGIL